MNAPNPQAVLAMLVDQFCDLKATAAAVDRDLKETQAQLYAALNLTAQPQDQPVYVQGIAFNLQLSACQRERRYRQHAMRQLHEKFGDTLLDLSTLSLSTFDRLVPQGERQEFVDTFVGSVRKTTIMPRK
jgi:hypothetical protein